MPEQFFDVNEDPDALNNLMDKPEYEKLIQQHQKQMQSFMETTADPMEAIYPNRSDKAVVAEYLQAMDEVSQHYRDHPEIYKRGYAAKVAKDNKTKPKKKAKKSSN
ncbi:MAG: hypothetical protein ACPGJU_01510 [Coraliomargarita sp.]